ncbi:DUF2478 domain-containing protein [Neisseriaceae bacterium ESL0693]|nr:DUF2478 domain-containing protein [Neisseriaceae bacterium ESL0693]
MQTVHLAAIVYDDDHDKQAMQIAWQVIEGLRQAGISVAGLMNKCDAAGQPIDEVVQSINDEREYTILQNLGTHSNACRLNAAALAESSMVLRDAIIQKPDVLLINRFGVTESEGGGLLAEFSAAVLAGIIVISLVHQRYVPQWRQFAGSLGHELPRDVDAIITWIKNGMISHD